jgi:hypothetical protein
MRRAAVIVTVVLALAAATAQSGRARTSLGTCPAKAVAGAKWRVLNTTGVPCGTAYGIVARLAARRIPASRIYAGTYAGMRCFGGPSPGGLPQSIICGTKAKTHFFSAYKGL